MERYADNLPEQLLESTDISLDEYIGILFRRKKIIGILMFVVFLPFLYMGLVQPYYYETRVIAIIENTSRNSFFENGMFPTRYTRKMNRTPEYYNLIVNSTPFKLALREKLKEEIVKNKLAFRESDIDEMLSSKMSFEYYYDRGSSGGFLRNACQFHVISKKPDYAYYLANYGFDVLKQLSLKLESQKSVQTLKYIEEQKKVLEEKILENEKEIQKFKQETGISIVDDLSAIEREIDKIQMHLIDVRTQAELERAKLKAIESQINEYNAVLKNKYNLNTSEIDTSGLRKKYISLVKKRNNYLQNPVVFKKELDQIEKQLAEITQQTVKSLLKRASSKGNNISLQLNLAHYSELLRKRDEVSLNIKMYSSQEKYYNELLKKFKTSNSEIFENRTKLAKLMLTKNVLSKAYNILIEKEQQEKIFNISEATQLKLINPAYFPKNTLPRSTKKYIVLGIIISVILSISIAFFMEFFDNSIKTPEDVKKYIHLPVLGIIPEISQNFISNIKKDKNINFDPCLIAYLKPSHQITESYRTLRTNIEHINPYKPIKSLLITSPSPFEGKTLTISNLSILFAQKGLKVLLMDLDLRKPKVHKVFGLNKETGFTDYLNDSATNYTKYLKTPLLDNHYILTIGDEVDKPAEILSTQEFKDRLDYLKSQFDIIFIDTPPVNVVTDAALVSNYVDGVLLVLVSLQTSKSSAKYSIELLNRVKANVIGVVLNKIAISRRYGSYGYYYYKRYYKSYYSYYNKDK